MKQKLQKPLSKFSPKILIVIVIPLVAIGVYTLFFAKAATPSNANLWIDPNGGTCSRVSGAGASWNDGTACPTLDAAWQKAVGGDTIGIKANTTPYAAFLPASSKNPAVRFIGEGADTTAVSNIDTQDGSGGIVFQDLKIKNYYNHTGTNGITYQNVKVEGNFFIRGSSNITWDNVESYIPGVGTTTENSNFISSNYSGGPGSDNIIIKNSYIHHYRRPPTPVCSNGTEMCHVDCIAVDDVNVLKIQNTRFEECEIFSIIFGTDNGTGKAARNVTVENNIFNMDGGGGPVAGAYNIAFTDTDASSVIRFNSFIDGKGIGFTGTPTAGTITFDSNALLQNNTGNCNNPAIASWSKNVIASGACSGDLSANPKFMGGSDAHLQSGSPAIDKGNSTNYPPTDFSGATRYTGSAPDAGAFEYGAIVTPSGPTANLWVDNNSSLTHSCTRSNNPEDYTTASNPTNHRTCSTLNDAWQSAIPGDKVIIKSSPSSYGNQAFLTRTSGTMSSPGVTFNAESGVTFGDILFGQDGLFCGNGAYKQIVDWITLKADSTNPIKASYLCFGGAANVTVDGITIDKNWAQDKAAFFAGGPASHPQTNITIRNADFSRVTNEKIMESQCNNASGYPCPAVTNLTIEDSKIHDMRRVPYNGIPADEVHNECFLASAVPGLTLRRTHWYGCTVMNFNFGAFGDSASTSQTNFHFVNNIFESPTDLTENDKTGFPWFQGCNTSAPLTKPGWVIEYNLFETSWYTQAGCGDQGALLRSNVGLRGLSCPVNATFVKNIWKEGTCGGTGSTADLVNSTILSSANFTNIGAHNWSYPAGAFQVDKGDTSTNCKVDGSLGGTGICYPSTDILGTTRPQGSAPDAGAYEYITSGGTAKAGDVNGDGSVNITDISVLLSAYGQTGSSLAADLDKNGSVNIADLSIILTNYGK